jgi:hypothetical protein
MCCEEADTSMPAGLEELDSAAFSAVKDLAAAVAPQVEEIDPGA